MRMQLIHGMLSVFLMTACSPRLSNSNSYEKEGYQLVWTDEFNQAGKPDSTHWGYEAGFVRMKNSNGISRRMPFVRMAS